MGVWVRVSKFVEKNRYFSFILFISNGEVTLPSNQHKEVK